MDGALEIYSYLIIAIISFIAPLTVYSLTTFNEGPDLIRKNTKETEEQTKKLVAIESEKNDYHPEIVDKSNKSLMNVRIKNQKLLILLTPESQIFRLFFPLIVAILLVMLFKLTEDETICIQDEFIRGGIILTSIISFITGLYFLKQVAWAIIYTQRLVYDKKTAETIKSVKEKAM